VRIRTITRAYLENVGIQFLSLRQHHRHRHASPAENGRRRVLLHNVKQPAAWPDTQPISFPRRIFCARVVASCFFVSTASPLHLPALRRGSGPNPWRQLQLRPRNEGAGGAPGGALPVVALVGRDATLARRGASRANTGTPPLGAPPRRCRPRNRSGPGTICGIRPVGCSRPAIVMAGYGTGLLVHGFTGRYRRHSPLRLLDRLRRRPS